mgnify:FL=1|jgi:hypothetical protein
MNIVQTGSGKEYEAKFLDINVNETRKLIKKLGGKLHRPIFKMKQNYL